MIPHQSPPELCALGPLEVPDDGGDVGGNADDPLRVRGVRG